MSETRNRPVPLPARSRSRRAGVSLPRSSALVVATALFGLLAAIPAPAESPAAKPPARGPDSSITLLPVRLAGRPIERITEFVGLLLEQRGLRSIKLGGTPPDVPPGADLAGLSAVVSAFARAYPATTGVVDLRNSHHPDFQAVKPESREGCDRLLARSLEGWSR